MSPRRVSLEDAGGDQIDMGQGLVTVRALFSRATAIRGDGGGGVPVGLLVFSEQRVGAAEVVILLREGEGQQATELLDLVVERSFLPGLPHPVERGQ